MTLTRRSLLLSMAGAALAESVKPAAAGPAVVKYGSGGYLDIYRAREQAAAPVIMFVHGGAWQYGNRSNVSALPAFFNRLGICFVSVGYRLVPNVTVPEQRDDVALAVGWVCDNIEAHGGDPARIALMGHSAGAHLASLVAVAGARGDVRCLISNDTRAYDLETLIPSSTGQARRVYERVFPDPSQWAALSPSRRIRAGHAPASLILWSGGWGRWQAANAFAHRLRDAGGTVETYGGSALSHRQINRLMGTGRVETLDRTVETFVRKHLF